MSNASVTIRRARPQDAPMIVALLKQLGYRPSVQQTAERLTDFTVRDDTVCFVAADPDRELVGCMQVMVQNRLAEGCYAEIASLVVAESARGKRVGSRLVARAAEWSREQDEDKLRVRCNAKRRGAHRFYRSLGFSETKEQKVFERSHR